MPQKLPTFLVIGAARSGTTSLYHHLRQHPAVYMSPVKEPNFFAAEGEDLPYEGPGEPVMEWVTDLDCYAGLFRDASSEKAIGEASPLYLYSPKAPERIHKCVPSAQL